MLVFCYDHTFEGLLCALFHAYSGKAFPEKLMRDGEPQPMFTETLHRVPTTPEKSARVWAGLRKRLSPKVCNMLIHVWLSEEADADELLFRYMRKVFDSPIGGVETNFADEDILQVRKIALKVSREGEHVRQFVRFQRAGDNTYFAAIAPKYNALPLSVAYFKDRFADQKWIVYDARRNYGFYYDLESVTEISLLDNPTINGQLDERLMAEDEKYFQELWRGYFNALTIRERINPKLQRQQMPHRFWKYLIEMQ